MLRSQCSAEGCWCNGWRGSAYAVTTEEINLACQWLSRHSCILFSRSSSVSICCKNSHPSSLRSQRIQRCKGHTFITFRSDDSQLDGHIVQEVLFSLRQLLVVWFFHVLQLHAQVSSPSAQRNNLIQHNQDSVQSKRCLGNQGSMQFTLSVSSRLFGGVLRNQSRNCRNISEDLKEIFYAKIHISIRDAAASTSATN